MTVVTYVQLLDKAVALRRGANASDKDKAEIEQLITEVERTNPTREPLKVIIQQALRHSGVV